MTRSILSALALVFILGVAVPGAAHANMAPPLREIRLGLSLEKTAEGPRVSELQKGYMGERAGLKVGDLIIGIDGRYARTMSDEDLDSFANDTHSWPIELIVVRGEAVLTIRVDA